MSRKGFSRKLLVGLGAVAAIVVAGAVVAVQTPERTSSGNEAGDAVASDRAASASPVAPLAGPEPALGQGQIGRVPPVGGGTIDPAGPKIVRTADLAVEVDDGRFGAAFDRVAVIATSHGGYVTSSTTATSGERRRPDSGQLTVRVPADRFEDARSALRQLGTVEQESLRGEDVSGQLVDYEARLRSLQAQEESLRSLLGRAGNVGEVLQVQTALFDVRQQIEQLEGQRAQLEQAAALATLQVAIYEPGAQPVYDPDPEPAHDLASSLERARDGALAVVGGMIVVVGWLAPLAVLGLAVWGGLRLRRRPAGPAPSTT